MGDDAARSRFSRRGFLARVGAGALAAGVGARGAPAAGVADPALGGFGRMFALPPFAQPSARLEQALLEIGKVGGIMDAKDELLSGAALLFSPENSHYDEVPSQLAADKNNRNNPISSAGTTFFAQFVAHDITFDATSPLGHATPVDRAMNARTVAFDLESVYLGGPAVAPHLYDGGTGRLAVESGGLYEDVPRSANGTPLMGDPRNDQTVILAGMHAAFLRFHNNALERVGGDFEQARRETRWHYQWLILHELLPKIVGQKLVDDVLAKGRRFYKPAGPLYIPVEFQAAAFRFGHSMIRPSYRVNPSGDEGKPFIGLIFDPAEDPAAGDPIDLRGGVRSPRRFVDWQAFFDFGDAQVRQSKRIDTTISTPLFHLPLGAIPGQQGTTSLPQRDLLRHVTWGLPSGQAIAKAMKVPALTAVHLRDLKPFGLGLEKSSPLWFYILKEAEVFEDGSRLGPVGGRIVAEVLIGILQLEASSYLRADPKWKPTFGGEKFGIVDFLTFAGVDPKSRALQAH